MATPQKENGYTAIANELLEAFAIHKFTEYQRVIILIIWRKTYGWNKKEDWISNSQFVELTGIPKTRISDTLRELKSLKVVHCTVNKLSINKNWEEWDVHCRVNKSSLIGEQKFTVQGTTKEKRKKRLPASQEPLKINTPSGKDSMQIWNEELGEWSKPPEKKVNASEKMAELVDWAKSRRGGGFMNLPKQYKAMAVLRANKVSLERIKNRWVELEQDEFYKRKGFDFMDVVQSFDKKP